MSINDKKSFWKSGSWIAYMATLAMTGFMSWLKAPDDAIIYLSLACLVGLPFLVAGRSLVDVSHLKVLGAIVAKRVPGASALLGLDDASKEPRPDK